MVRADRPCSPSRRYFPCSLTADDRSRHPSPFSPCPVLRRNPHGYIIIIPLPYVKRPAPGQPASGRPLPPLHTKCPLRRSSIAETGDRFNPFPHRSGKPLPRRPDRAQTSPVRRPPRAGQYSSLRERPCPPAWMSRSPRRFRPVLPRDPSLTCRFRFLRSFISVLQTFNYYIVNKQLRFPSNIHILFWGNSENFHVYCGYLLKSSEPYVRMNSGKKRHPLVVLFPRTRFRVSSPPAPRGDRPHPLSGGCRIERSPP